MHYVICYDLENDRLRDRVAKLLERNGCRRIQKSVFAAPDLNKKHLVRLQLSLRQLFGRRPMSAGDSLYLIPLPEEYVPGIETIGENNLLPVLEEKPLKIIL